MIVYNEIDPYPVEWLRNLIHVGALPEGVIYQRSIRALGAHEVRGKTCHFFAGIGGWPRALRLLGIPDTAAIWTGSPPCQPFSRSGSKKGFDDDRHLWPDWFKLIEECRPSIVFGEQTASDDGFEWLDAVSNDLEGAGWLLPLGAVVPDSGKGIPPEPEAGTCVVALSESLSQGESMTAATLSWPSC